MEGASQEMSEKPSRLSEFLRHPMANVLIGFLLTGVIGVWLASTIQERADTAARRSEIREARRTTALAVADTVGVLLNRTTYLFGEYWNAINQGFSPEETDRRQTSFDSARAAFESRRYVDAARVEVHFGPALRARYEDIADSLQFLVGNFQIVRRNPARADDFKPSVTNVQHYTSCLLLQLVWAADSVATYDETTASRSQPRNFEACMEAR
jgi:hypothetical protein